jgi:hypothetical protein
MRHFQVSTTIEIVLLEGGEFALTFYCTNAARLLKITKALLNTQV